MARFKYIEIIRDEDDLVVKRVDVSKNSKKGITRIQNKLINETNINLFSIKLNEYERIKPIKDNPYLDETL